MRIHEMLANDDHALEFFGRILASNKPWAVQGIYDELEAYGIPDGEESRLFHELMPEIVDWFTNTMLDPDMGYMSLDYAVHLIENEQLTALIPYVVKFLKANKQTVVKNLLHAIKDNQGAVLSREFFENLDKFNLGWPELEAVRKSLTTKK
jgi:hypothetical protein